LIGQLITRREVVPIGHIVVISGGGNFFGRGNLADAFDIFYFLMTMKRESAAAAGPADIFITILLQLFEADRTFIESIDDPGEFVRVGKERGGRLRVHEEGRELGGGDLKADFRKLLGVVFAQVIGEMILEVREAKLVLLLGTPFLVTAARAPVGDIAFGDGDVSLCKSPDDFGIGNVVVEKFVDHVAFEFGQAGNFAVAHALTELSAGGGRSGDDALECRGLRRIGCGWLDGAALDERAFLFDAV